MSVVPHKSCLKFSFIIIFLQFFQPLSARQDWTDVDQFIAANQKALGKEFLVMAWKKDDTLAYKKEVGMFNSKSQQGPLSQVSHWLTTALAMVMVDEGKISLDDKISTYLPEFGRYGKNYITIRTCLSHTTGIRETQKFASKIFQKLPSKSLEEEVDRYASRDIRANPTVDFWYGNTGIQIVGRVLEIVGKKRFDVLIKQKLFTPLTMRRTSFTSLDGGPLNPAAGAVGTGDDMMKFLVMLMNRGRFGDKQILSEESVAEMFRIHARQNIMKFIPEPFADNDYCFGAFALTEKDGEATSLACPGWAGSYAAINLEKGYAFLVLPKEPVDEENTRLYQQMYDLIGNYF